MSDIKTKEVLRRRFFMAGGDGKPLVGLKMFIGHIAVNIVGRWDGVNDAGNKRIVGRAAEIWTSVADVADFHQRIYKGALVEGAFNQRRWGIYDHLVNNDGGDGCGSEHKCQTGSCVGGWGMYISGIADDDLTQDHPSLGANAAYAKNAKEGMDWLPDFTYSTPNEVALESLRLAATGLPDSESKWPIAYCNAYVDAPTYDKTERVFYEFLERDANAELRNDLRLASVSPPATATATARVGR